MMLKKTITAGALASLAISGAYASTLTVSSANATKKVGVTVSSQGVISSDVIEYAAGQDELVYKVQGNAAVVAGFANSLKHIDIALTNGVISPASSISATWGGQSMSSDSVASVTFPTASTIRLTTVVSTTAGDSIESGSTLTLSGLKVLPVTTTSGSTVTGTVTAVSTVADGTIDSGSGTIATYINEFYASIAAANRFNEKIDVAQDREAYAGGAADLLTISFTELTADQHDVVTASPVFTVNGDFAFLDNDGDGKFESTEGTIVKSGGDAGTVTFNASAASASTGTVSGSTKTATFAVTPSKTATAKVIPAQSFTAGVVVTYTDGAGVATAKQSFAGLNAGSWELNAASTSIPYLPFGSAYAHSIAITNPNTAAGEIAITLVGNGKTVTESLDVVAAGKSTTEIGALVGAIAAENGITAASLLVVVNAKDITVKGLYYAKADGDRVLMN